MARKGQKYNQYSEELKEQVLEDRRQGIGGPKYLSEKYGIPFRTIKTWVDKRNHPERFPNAGNKKRGRPKDSEIDWKERYEILKKYRTFLEAQRERK